MLPSKSLVLDSHFLVKMADDELCSFADKVLGIPIPKDTSRNTILTRIFNSAI